MCVETGCQLAHRLDGGWQGRTTVHSYHARPRTKYTAIILRDFDDAGKPTQDVWHRWLHPERSHSSSLLPRTLLLVRGWAFETGLICAGNVVLVSSVQ